MSDPVLGFHIEKYTDAERAQACADAFKPLADAAERIRAMQDRETWIRFACAAMRSVDEAPHANDNIHNIRAIHCAALADDMLTLLRRREQEARDAT